MAVRLHERAICLCGAPAAAPPGGGGRGPPLPAPGRSAEGRGAWAGCPALDGGAAGVSLEALGGAEGVLTVPLVPLDAGLELGCTAPLRQDGDFDLTPRLGPPVRCPGCARGLRWALRGGAVLRGRCGTALDDAASSRA